MARGQVELGGDAGLGGAAAQQAGIGARAQRQAQSIEQDRFAGAGLAGQHAQARREGEIEAVDQDDVADGEAEQHRLSAGQKTLLSQEPGFFSGFRFFAFQQVVADLIPGAARVVVAEHGGGRLGLVVDAQRQIAFGQALERLRHMASWSDISRPRCGSG